MKKILLLFLILMITGCAKKADVICTSKNELFTTEVGLYFDGNMLIDAYNISAYDDESFAQQICESLGDRVKCYESNVEIVSFYDSYKNTTKFSVISDLEKQGFICK